MHRAKRGDVLNKKYFSVEKVYIGSVIVIQKKQKKNVVHKK
jgi:hypothetical protein